MSAQPFDFVRLRKLLGSDMTGDIRTGRVFNDSEDEELHRALSPVANDDKDINSMEQMTENENNSETIFRR